MDANERRCRIDALTEQVIGCAYRVSNELGVGFLEKVYENALKHEIQKCDLMVEQQVPQPVYYDGVVVGEYFVDLCVEQEVIVELKHAKALNDVHLAQCLNYLKAMNRQVALLLNFGTSRVQVKRVVNNY